MSMAFNWFLRYAEKTVRLVSTFNEVAKAAETDAQCPVWDWGVA